MSDTVSRLAKPQLRGSLANLIKKNLIIAVGLCTVAAIAQKILVNDARKDLYANFYKSYDINKQFNIMRNKGLFDSCNPDK